MKTKAAILEQIGKLLVLDELEIMPLEVGQVLVEVHASSICGRQLAEISGAKGPDKYLPHLMGHEGGGVVLEIGPGVKCAKPGDHVVMHWRKGAGIDANPPKYGRGKGFVGAGQVATFATHSVVSENRLTPISDDFDLSTAALMGCAVTTGLGLINNEAKLKIGQSIAVIGCGGVGLNVIQGAALVGGNPIFGFDKNRDKMDMALESGATKVGNTSDRFDVVVETTGIPALIEMAFKLTAPGGKCIMVGQPPHGVEVEFNNFSDNFTGKTLMDSQGGLTEPHIDIPRYLEMYRKGKLKLDNLITHTFPFSEINMAIKYAKVGDAGKVMVEME